MKYGRKIKYIIYITYFGTNFAWLKYFTYRLVPVLAPDYKQHILLPANVRKVSYALAKVYVKCVYLKWLGWGVKFMKHYKVWHKL
jgi:hypothetical protein